MYLSSFQSFLWNRILSDLVREASPDAFPVELKAGTVRFFRTLSRPLGLIPLPSARARFDSEEMRGRVEASLKEIGLELKAIRIRHPRENFFSRGERPATFRPAGLASEWGADELYPGRTKLNLGFDLPRGSYATILVKRITAC